MSRPGNSADVEFRTSGETGVPLDRSLFLLEDSDFDAFNAALVAPTEPNEALLRTMNAQPPWRERSGPSSDAC